MEHLEHGVHGSGHAVRSERRLALAIAVVALVLVAEVATGIRSGSLALLGDAGHLVTDVGTLGLAWFGIRRSHRPASATHTFGHHRAGIIIAVVNGALLAVVATAILVAAALRLRSPVPVEAGPVMVVAAVALCANVGIALSLAHDEHGDLGVRSALLHVIGDALASAGVIVAGAVIALTGWVRADAVVSILISLVIGTAAVTVLREALRILSESTPTDLDLDAVRSAMSAMPGVEDVHDLHVWSLNRRHRALSAHVTVGDRSLAEVTTLLRGVELELCARFSIEHVTLQPECPSCATAAGLFCDLEEHHLRAHDAAPETLSREGGLR